MDTKLEAVGHTAGEWTYGVRRDKSMWLSLGNPSTGPHYQGDLHASEADARLICAAPDLLGALKAMVLNDTHTYRDCHKAALQAIAKAEGRAS